MSMTTDAGGDGIVGIRAAAKVLKLNPSTISRYLQDYPSLNLGNDTRPKVDVAKLRRHRVENVNPARGGAQAGTLLGEGEDGKPKGSDTSAGAVLLRARASRATTRAQSERLDLDAKRGLLVPRAEVEAAVYEAGQAFQRELLELGPQLSERLAVMTVAREIAALLETELRQVLAKLAAALRAQGDADAAA
ncbi:MAG: hypothetical protein IID48_00365 [Proteobacteria bacterium]|nr:hypothetical protein [Pseudomonadota bacterium]